jgi:serine/threonine protein kinase
VSDIDNDLTFDSSVTRTRDVPRATGPAGNTEPGAASSSRRFAPGVIVAGRYRLVGLLGRGGMGEVYRAEDLTLDQPVALKFLPPGIAVGDARLRRFHDELRVARQVSHKNVCRLYDLGDADGQRFLTMEYVDGEDLSSLLRRIGRLPQDKAVQIARQLCAGVAAAHDRPVLHRDLKPANVMIDGQGDVRITDFGIATAAASDAAQEFIGTPQYMAPELFSGNAASVESDVYALGLTLYELFTGKRVHESATIDEIRKQHETGTLTTPRAVVRDLDPAIERAILRCLERDPARRPPSALAVSAMLPGADALADALAAGETPSPELLAAAAESDALPVWRGLATAAAVVVGVVVFAGLSGRYSIVGRTPHDLPPLVLADRAKAIVRAAGHTDAPRDEAYALATASGYVNWLRRTRRGDMSALSSGQPSGLTFWYRSSPRGLETLSGSTPTTADPPFDIPAMRLVELDAAGRLQMFRSVPPQQDATSEPAPSVDWRPFFAAAELDVQAFTQVAPQWTPRDFADMRLAWEGPLPGLEGERLRVEAGAYGGRPVSFRLVAPWTTPVRMEAQPQDVIDRVFLVVAVIVLGFVMAVAAGLARRNVRLERADRRGAARLAGMLGGVILASWLVAAVDAGIATLAAHIRAAAFAALFAGVTWMLYLALEPYARRFWPHMLLGWSRLLAGHVRDPRVGGDLLAGAACGVALAYGDVLRSVVMPSLGYYEPMPIFGGRVELLLGTGPLVAQWLNWLFYAVLGALLTVLGLVLLRLALRRTWLVVAAAASLLLWTGANFMGSSSQWMWLFPLAQGILLAVLTVRHGLLALAAARFVWYVLNRVPMTADVSHWSAAASNLSLLLLVAIACFAFYASRAGQPLFGAVLED